MKTDIKKTSPPITPNRPFFLKEQISSNTVLKTESNEYDNLKDLIFKSLKDEEDFNLQKENSSLLLEKIINILEKLSTTLKEDKKLLYNILKEIYIIVYLLICEFTSNSQKKIILNKDFTYDIMFIPEDIDDNENSKEKNIDINNLKENKVYKFNSNSKISFLVKIETLNRKIASLNDELKAMKILLNDSNEKLNQNKNDNRYKYFLKKLEDIKVKTKCDELKYLIYIDNQQKKIADLENQLKIKHHENLSNEVLKSIRCFPNFVQYNFKEDINPKTLPLHEFLLTYKNQKNKNHSKPRKNIKSSKSVKNKKQIQLLYNTINTINNSDRHIYKSIEIFKNKNNTEINNDKFKKGHIINIKDMNNNGTYHRNKNNLNIENAFKSDNLYDSEFEKNEYRTLNPSENNLKENNEKKFIIKKNLIKQVKEFHPETIMTNKKEFFLAHPTLNIAGVTKGREQAYIGLPKKLLRLNQGGHFKTMMVFPSSLNETMVNLEKLRNNRWHDFDKNGD